MSLRSQTRRTLLLCFIASIGCCGLVGIYCLIFGSFDEVAVRVLLTTSAVGIASILALASALPWERRKWSPIGPCGLAVICIALLMVLAGIWKPDPFEPQWYYKMMFVGCVQAVALPHVGLLSLAKLRGQYEWVRVVTVVVIVGLTAQISWSIAAETDNELWYRLMGVVAIVNVCGTIAVPVLHRISTIRLKEDVYAADSMEMIFLTCPRCGKSQEVPLGRSQCQKCQLELRIEIENEQRGK